MEAPLPRRPSPEDGGDWQKLKSNRSDRTCCSVCAFVSRESVGIICVQFESGEILSLPFLRFLMAQPPYHAPIYLITGTSNAEVAALLLDVGLIHGLFSWTPTTEWWFCTALPGR
eukprot:TRINITY_DN20556_c0_g1_i2.p1 TRINITY_DN20556_c0_g1~~TRINITY_DN20556_c0_g1_i2.p1  ORF type:complete len:115 (-),score=9.45 TRINITY_DN20556_c0_g1_i2:161-505(-)